MCYCRAVVVLCGIFLIAAAVIWPVMMLSLQRNTADNTPRWATHTKSCIRRFVITEKAPTRAFSWLKAATTAFTFTTLLRHYAKLALTPRSLNVK